MADGHHLILDAGSGLRALGVQLETLPRPDIGIRILPVLLTHRHSDHIIGLPHFVPMASPSYRIRISCGDVPSDVLAPFIRQQLTEPIFPTIDGLEDSVEVRDFDALNGFTVSAACHVRAFEANHPGGASIYRIDDPSGPVLAYAPDNELADRELDPTLGVWRHQLAESLRDVPVLLHDATYTEDELHAHRGWGHSSAEEATRFAIACNAGMLLLMHHHPDRTDDEIDAMVTHCQLIARSSRSPLIVQAAFDGMVHTIS